MINAQFAHMMEDVRSTISTQEDQRRSAYTNMCLADADAISGVLKRRSKSQWHPTIPMPELLTMTPDDAGFAPVTFANDAEFAKFSIPGNIDPLVDQLGRALAQRDHWKVTFEWKDTPDEIFYKGAAMTLPIPSDPNSKIFRGYVLEHKHEGRVIAAVLIEKTKTDKYGEPYTIVLAEVYEWVESRWHHHDIATDMRHRVWNFEGVQFGQITWTKYHLLAVMLTNQTINIECDVRDIADIWGKTTNSFQREMFSKVCGYHYSDWKTMRGLLIDLEPSVLRPNPF